MVELVICKTVHGSYNTGSVTLREPASRFWNCRYISGWFCIVPTPGLVVAFLFKQTEHTRTRTGYKVLSLDICCYAMWHTVAERSNMKEQVSRKVVVKWRSSMREVAWRTSETQGEMRKVQGLSSNTTTSSECVKKNTGDWSVWWWKSFIEGTPPLMTQLND